MRSWTLEPRSSRGGTLTTTDIALSTWGRKFKAKVSGQVPGTLGLLFRAGTAGCSVWEGRAERSCGETAAANRESDLKLRSGVKPAA